jgi:hypothetical protein
MALAGWRAFALPAAYGTKKSPAPSFVVFERWGSMLRAGMGFGLPSACFGGDSVRSTPALRAASCPALRLRSGQTLRKPRGGHPRVPQRLKPGFIFSGFTARVNSCPSRAWRAFEFSVLLRPFLAAAEAVFLFLRVGLARVTSCPSRACWAFGSWSASAVLGLPQRLKPS